MHKTTDSYDPRAFEGAEARNLITRSSAAVTVLRREPAGNDDRLEEPASSREELDAWASHAFASNGFGDDGLPTGDTWAWATSYELQKATRAERAFAIAEIITAMARAVGDAAQRAYARYRQWRLATQTYDTLQGLGDRELKDLGFARSELASVAAELAGRAEHTRRRVARASHGPAAAVRDPA